MSGAPIEAAKNVVRRALKGARPDDTLQILRFTDRASGLWPAPVPATAENVRRAIGYLDTLRGEGGTEMLSGIRAALDRPEDPERLRIVAFLTDGYIGNEDEVLRLVGAHLGPARLFSFGVGSAVNRYLLEEMARIGRGAVEIVRPDEETRAAVGRFHDRIARPLLTDVTVDWNGLDVRDQVPAAIPDLFLGQPLVVAARYATPGRGVVTVHARKAGQVVSFQVPVTLPDRDEARPSVGSVWARARIAELSRQLLRLRDADAEAAGLRERITAIALEHHLMSAYTAFVAVDTRRATAGGRGAEVAVPVEVPEGVRRPYVILGSAIGEAYGSGGLGFVGTGSGGGGVGYGMAAPVAISNLGTSGRAAGGIGGQRPVTGQGYGSEFGSLGARRAARPPDIVIAGDAVTVRGSLGVETIRRTIRRRQNEIRNCYELELQKHHKLEGRLVLELTIAGSGQVTAASISESTLNSEPVGACVVAVARAWTFPSTAGGGDNLVHYPYVFQPSAPLPYVERRE
jgi:Ca-activated chloride channel family protein